VKTRVLIVGGGFAGASAAAALAKDDQFKVTLIEEEKVPGVHSSGRNASMARRVIEDPLLSKLACMSIEGIRRLEIESGVRLMSAQGGLLIGRSSEIEPLYRSASVVPELKSDMQLLDRHGLIGKVSVLDEAESDAGIATSECGVVDIHALLSHYFHLARTRGAECLTNHRLVAIDTEGGMIKRACVNGSWHDVDVIVNAAGYAANHISNLAGLSPLPLNPSRRHLFVTSSWTQVEPNWPFVWDISHGLYFRPESGGLLMCACDETAWSKGDVPVDETMRQILAEKFSAFVPKLTEARPAYVWAGLRVLTPDGRFIIGEDPRMRGFYWAAGLGGHGMTTSYGVGELVAQALTQERSRDDLIEAFSPGRFLKSTDKSFAA
tara:strand:- start:197 stop:1333 length:1137 start_codon:yes stop_codon:yes gene_type:complete